MKQTAYSVCVKIKKRSEENCDDFVTPEFLIFYSIRSANVYLQVYSCSNGI